MTTLHLTLNGEQVEAEIAPTATLQHALHHVLGRREVRYGCGEGACGACAVLLDGVAVPSCLLLALQADGAEVTTAAAVAPALVREQLIGHEAFQCGYCACGMLVASAHHVASGGGADPDAVRHALSGNICRCSGYGQIVEAVAAAADGSEPPDGTRRIDLVEKLDGTARYPSDGHIEGALVGTVVWSEHPSARIRGIDTREAKGVPGVEAVVTSRDVPGRNLATTTLFGPDEPLLARGRVRSMGDAVALIAARTEAAAREARERIRVDYEPLPAVTDVARAIAPGAPRLGGSGNVIVQFVEARGDVASAFGKAHAVVEGTYRCAPTDHGTIELEGGTGWIEDGHILLDVGCQTPFTVRRGVARALGIPVERVAIAATRAGGVFGKYLMPSVDGWLALLVHLTGRPVRLVLSREEVLARRAKRHPVLGRYKLGLDGAGKFVALEVDVLVDSGPYRQVTPTVAALLASEGAGAYHVPDFLVRVRGVLTNNLPSAPARGYGSQQANFGMESIVARAIHELGLDPVETRRLNVSDRHGPGERETLETAAKDLPPLPEPDPGWRVGRGVATISAKYGYPAGFVDRTLVRLSVDETGAFLVEADIVDAGTGVPVEAQRLAARALGLDEPPAYAIAAEALADPTGGLFANGEVPPRLRTALFNALEAGQLTGSRVLFALLAGAKPGRVRQVVKAFAVPANLLGVGANALKTALFPYGIDSYIPRTAGSRGTLMTGRAVLAAAGQIRVAARGLAASRFEVEPVEIEVDGRGARVRGDLNRSLTWSELAAAAGGRLAATGRAVLPARNLVDPATGIQSGTIDAMPATHVADVAVHPETGEVRILNYVAAHDLGRVLSPRIVRGQILGGIAMGVGQALLERLRVENGQVTSTGLRDYLVPTSLDVPGEVDIRLIETNDGLGPFGAKGIGEAAAVGAPPAIANAIYDALGRQPTEIPATPDLIAAAAPTAPPVPQEREETSSARPV